MKTTRIPLLAAALTLGVMVSPAVALADGNTRIYIPLGSAGKVMVLDPATDRPVGMIGELPDTHGLAITPDGRILIAGSLSTAPANAASAIPPKPPGMSEEEHASHHGGGTPPAGGEVSYLSFVNAESGAILRRVPVPGAVHHVAISPDGQTVAATHSAGGGISLVNIHHGVVTATVPTGPQPNYLAFSGDGTRLYVSNAGDGTVSELKFGHGISQRKLTVGETPEHLVLSSDGKRLYVNDVDNGAVIELDLETWTVARRFEIGGLLHGIDLSADGATLFAAARERNEIVAIDLATGDITRAPLAPEPYHLTVAPGVGKIYVSSAGAAKIWAVDSKSLAVVSEIPIEGEGHQMTVW